MSMSDYIEQQEVEEFFAKKGFILLENNRTGFFCFIRVGETYRKYASSFESK